MIVPGETCVDAPDLTAGGTVMGDTTNAQNDFDPSVSDGCGVNIFGKEQVFKLSPSAITTYHALVTIDSSSKYDPALYVLHSCGGTCIDGTVLNGQGEQESLTFTVGGGETAFLVVDGEGSVGSASGGIYTLTVTIQ